MYVACFFGHLNVSQWLFKVGAAANIRTKNILGWTPMHAACGKGHLDVAQWLFEVGAAADICTKNNAGQTPMYATHNEGRLHMTQWLLLQGTADGDDGHVDRTILHVEVPKKDRSALRASLLDLVTVHATFASTMLLATTSIRVAPQPTYENIRAAKRLPAVAHPCVLTSLRGH
jgi:ankyrin repeat protein